jgi:hypothetical protein
VGSLRLGDKLVSALRLTLVTLVALIVLGLVLGFTLASCGSSHASSLLVGNASAANHNYNRYHESKLLCKSLDATFGRDLNPALGELPPLWTCNGLPLEGVIEILEPSCLDDGGRAFAWRPSIGASVCVAP